MSEARDFQKFAGTAIVVTMRARAGTLRAIDRAMLRRAVLTVAPLEDVILRAVSAFLDRSWQEPVAAGETLEVYVRHELQRRYPTAEAPEFDWQDRRDLQ